MLPRWQPRALWARAIGAPELVAHLRGESTLDQAIERRRDRSQAAAARLVRSGPERLAVEQVRDSEFDFFFLSISLSRRVVNGGERGGHAFFFSLLERTSNSLNPQQFAPHRSRPTSKGTSDFWSLPEACSGGCEKRRPQSRRRRLRLRLQCRLLFLLLRPASSAPPGRAAAGRQEDKLMRMTTGLLRRERSCGSACAGC